MQRWEGNRELTYLWGWVIRCGCEQVTFQVHMANLNLAQFTVIKSWYNLIWCLLAVEISCWFKSNSSQRAEVGSARMLPRKLRRPMVICQSKTFPDYLFWSQLKGKPDQTTEHWRATSDYFLCTETVVTHLPPPLGNKNTNKENKHTKFLINSEGIFFLSLRGNSLNMVLSHTFIAFH